VVLVDGRPSLPACFFERGKERGRKTGKRKKRWGVFRERHRGKKKKGRRNVLSFSALSIRGKGNKEEGGR